MQKGVPLFVGLLLLVISPLNAQVAIDVAKINCQQFATYKVANPDRLAIWLDGYFHGKRGDLSVDTQELLHASTNKLKAYCLKVPDVLLMQAVEVLFGSANRPRDCQFDDANADTGQSYVPASRPRETCRQFIGALRYRTNKEEGHGRKYKPAEKAAHGSRGNGEARFTRTMVGRENTRM